jgi:2-oxoglutarate ferredoxin oxidoreductase subunit alpha
MDADVAHLREKVELPAPGTFEVVERLRPGVPPDWYAPYSESEGPVPPLATFGTGYRFHITGLFHDIHGFPTTRLDEINPAIERVFGKIEHHLADILQWEEFAMEGAEMAVVAYGSVARAALRAVKEARRQGLAAGLVKLLTLWPFPEMYIAQLAERCRLLVVPEMNLGQLVLEVERAACGRARVRRVNRADGAIITPAQILAALREE